MRTLHFGLHVADLDRALAFYTALSYEVVGSVPETGIGHLTMLKLPDDDFVSIELVHDPGRGDVAGGTGRDQPRSGATSRIRPDGCPSPAAWRSRRAPWPSAPQAPACTSRTPPPSCSGCRSRCGGSILRSTASASSPFPTGTCPGPTADDGSSGWSELVNAQQPDVVAVVGDLMDGEVDELRDDVAPLADLVSRQGVYFVTGNHEYFVDTRAWLRHLPTLGVDVLRNERVPVGRGGATFDLAGIDDRTAAASGVPGHGANLDAALDGRDDATPVVLLAHQPVQVAQAAAAGWTCSCPGTRTAGSCGPSTT